MCTYDSLSNQKGGLEKPKHQLCHLSVEVPRKLANIKPACPQVANAMHRPSHTLSGSSI